MTKKIYKNLALPVAAAMMLLSMTACSSENNDIVEQVSTPAVKSNVIPVTVNVSRTDGESSTRATYDATNKKLDFSAGDQLFIQGTADGSFAGTLTYTSGTTFQGTVSTSTSFADFNALITAATTVTATLLPADYADYGYLSIANTGANATLAVNPTKAIASAKATAVEQFSLEQATAYNNGFSLSPQNAIMSNTVSGLAASTGYATSASDGSTTIEGGNRTTDESGSMTFAVGFTPAEDKPYTITCGDYTFALGKKTFQAGHIYNTTPELVRISASNSGSTLHNGDILTGEGGVTYNVAENATVTLQDIEITQGGYNSNAIVCLGNANIILTGQNSITVGQTGILAGGSGTTLTIQGSGSLETSMCTAIGINSSDGLCGNIIFNSGSLTADLSAWCTTAIGGGDFNTCGNITINGGTITATGGDSGGCCGIGAGHSGDCGNITINGGTVNVTIKEQGAGIGTGPSGYCGDITITGGTIIASSDAGAGIGSGYSGTCGKITISGGTVTATGGAGSNGIGGPNCGNITISGGTVTAKGRGGAEDIGSSKIVYNDPGNFSASTSGQVIISPDAIQGGTEILDKTRGIITFTPTFKDKTGADVSVSSANVKLTYNNMNYLTLYSPNSSSVIKYDGIPPAESQTLVITVTSSSGSLNNYTNTTYKATITGVTVIANAITTLSGVELVEQ